MPAQTIVCRSAIVLVLVFWQACHKPKAPPVAMEPPRLGCLESKILIDTSSIEKLYSHPEQILKDPEGFWASDRAYRYAGLWHKNVGVPVQMDRWKAELEKASGISAGQRQSLPALQTAARFDRDQRAFLKETLSHICQFLPPRKTVDLNTTVYLTAHLRAYAFMTDTNIVISLNSPHWRGSPSFILNTIVHEIFHIGYGKNRFLRSEEELHRDAQYQLLDALHNEGIATYVGARIRHRFPAKENPDYSMLDNPATVGKLLSKLNLLLSGSARMNDEEISRQSWQIGVMDRAYYVVGAHMARTIDRKSGRAALIETIESGPRSFVDTYNSLVEEPHRVFGFKPPDSADIYARIKRAVTYNERNLLTTLIGELRLKRPLDPSAQSKIDRLGYRAIFLERPDMAVEILSLNVELFPQSANAHDSLGEAFWRNHERLRAINHYRQSLELDPTNTNAERMLKKLKATNNRLYGPADLIVM